MPKPTKMTLYLLLLTLMLSTAPLLCAANTANRTQPNFFSKFTQKARSFLWSAQKKVPYFCLTAVAALAYGSFYASNSSQKGLFAGAALFGPFSLWVYYRRDIEPYQKTERAVDGIIKCLRAQENHLSLEHRLPFTYDEKLLRAFLMVTQAQEKLLELFDLACLSYGKNNELDATLDKIIDELIEILPSSALQTQVSITLPKIIGQFKLLQYDRKSFLDRAGKANSLIDKLAPHNTTKLQLIDAVESLNPSLVVSTVKQLPADTRNKEINDVLFIIRDALIDVQKIHFSFPARILANQQRIVDILNIILPRCILNDDTRKVLTDIFQVIAPFANKELVSHMQTKLGKLVVQNTLIDPKTVLLTIAEGNHEILELQLKSKTIRDFLFKEAQPSDIDAQNIIEWFTQKYGNNQNEGDIFFHYHLYSQYKTINPLELFRAGSPTFEKLILLIIHGQPFSGVIQHCTKYIETLTDTDKQEKQLIYLLILIGTPIKDVKQLFWFKIIRTTSDPMQLRKRIYQELSDPEKELYKNYVYRRYQCSNSYEEQAVLAAILKDVFNYPMPWNIRVRGALTTTVQDTLKSTKISDTLDTRLADLIGHIIVGEKSPEDLQPTGTQKETYEVRGDQATTTQTSQRQVSATPNSQPHLHGIHGLDDRQTDEKGEPIGNSD